jgi:ABC-type multidrug transport system ATPase subunit
VGSKAVFDYIDLLREQNKAIIVSTHRLDEAQRLCDRFGLIFEGKLRMEGSLEQLQRDTGQSSLVEMFLKILNEESVAVESRSDSKHGLFTEEKKTHDVTSIPPDATTTINISDLEKTEGSHE